ncbi:N/A [soil metagenome]
MPDEVSPELNAVIEAVRGLGINDGALTVMERRALISFDGPDPDGVAIERVDAGGVPSEWIVAEGAATDRAVLHLHGGAFVAGGLGSHRGFAAKLSETTGSAVLLVDYRLAPEAPFPAALDDAVAAYRWILDRGIDPAAVVVSGDSAGGGLAASLLVALRDQGQPLPAGAVLLSPWTDLALTGASHQSEDGRDPLCSTAMLDQSAEAYLDGADRTDPAASPLYADLSGLPPMLIHVGEVEVLRDDSVQLAERARAAGTPVELHVGAGMVHVWHLFADVVPESTRDQLVVARWIATRQSLPVTTPQPEPATRRLT